MDMCTTSLDPDEQEDVLESLWRCCSVRQLSSLDDFVADCQRHKDRSCLVNQLPAPLKEAVALYKDGGAERSLFGTRRFVDEQCHRY